MRPVLQLLVLSVGLGLLWRLEVAWHGWEGLIWIGYVHLAVPVGVVAFLVWLATTPVVRSSPRRWGLLGVATVHAGITVFLTRMLLFELFGRFAFLAIYALYGLVAQMVFAPAVAWGLGRLLGFPLRRWTLPVSILLLAASPWLAMLVLDVLGTRADGIHTIKSGAIIPFVVFAFGLPWVFPVVGTEAAQR